MNKWRILLNLQSVGILKIPKAEEKNKKTSEKIWKFKIKVLTFATAIKNNDSEISSLKILHISTSSTSILRINTVNT